MIESALSIDSEKNLTVLYPNFVFLRGGMDQSEKGVRLLLSLLL